MRTNQVIKTGQFTDDPEIEQQAESSAAMINAGFTLKSKSALGSLAERLDKLKIPDSQKSEIAKMLSDVRQGVNYDLFRVITKLWQREDQIRYLTKKQKFDFRTGLLTHSSFTNQAIENLKKMDRRSDRHETGTHIVVGFMDVRNFKAFNDTHGHLAGDRLLKALGNAILKCFRMEDLPTRYAGDEFCFFLSNVKYPERSDDIFMRLKNLVAEFDLGPIIGKYSEKTSIVQIDIGKICVARSTTKVTTSDAKAILEQALKLADNNMYHEKNRAKQGHEGKIPIEYFGIEGKSLVKLPFCDNNQSLQLEDCRHA